MHPDVHSVDKRTQSDMTLYSEDSPNSSSTNCTNNFNFIKVQTEPSSEQVSTKCSNQIKHIAVSLLLGQLVAGLIGVTAVCSTLLVNNGVSLPLAQNLPLYLLLSLCYGLPRLICLLKSNTNHHPPHRTSEKCSDRIQKRNRCRKFISSRYFWYIIAGLIDVHANWAIVSAYAYTTVTSIQLLDCITIPTTVILSYLFLNHRYLWNHYVSLVMCFIGAIGMVLTDYFTASSNSDPSTMSNLTSNETSIGFSARHMILGDFLVLIGVIAYGFSNVMQQYLVVKYGIIDFLGFMGLSGLIPITIYSFAIEWNQIRWVFFDPTSPTVNNLGPILGFFAGFWAAMFLLYSIMPLALSRSGAVLVNLSLLTADVYALLMGIYLFHYKFHALYIVCFLVILFGVALFNIKQPFVLTNHTNCCVRLVFSPSCSGRQSHDSNATSLSSGESTDLPELKEA